MQSITINDLVKVYEEARAASLAAYDAYKASLGPAAQAKNALEDALRSVSPYKPGDVIKMADGREFKVSSLHLRLTSPDEAGNYLLTANCHRRIGSGTWGKKSDRLVSIPVDPDTILPVKEDAA